MKYDPKIGKTNAILFRRVVISAAVSMMSSIVLSMLLTYLIIENKTSLEIIRYALACGIVISSAIGGIVSSHQNKQRFISALLSGLCYIVLLGIVNVAVYRSGFEGIVATTILVLGTYISTALITIKLGRENRRFVKLYKMPIVGK